MRHMRASSTKLASSSMNYVLGACTNLPKWLSATSPRASRNYGIADKNVKPQESLAALQHRRLTRFSLEKSLAIRQGVIATMRLSWADDSSSGILGTRLGNYVGDKTGEMIVPIDTTLPYLMRHSKAKSTPQMYHQRAQGVACREAEPKQRGSEFLTPAVKRPHSMGSLPSPLYGSR